MKIRFLSTMFWVLFLTCSSLNTIASETEKSAEQVIDTLYDLVSFEKGNSPDWQKVRQLFFDEAVIELRTSRTELALFDLDGFINDFKKFIESANVEETGFTETILKKHGKVFGNVAWFSVLYEAEVTGTKRKNQGVDHISLVKMEDKWRIISITNEIPSETNPLPEELKN